MRYFIYTQKELEVAIVEGSSIVGELKMFISIDVVLRFNKTDVKFKLKIFLNYH